MHLSDFLASQTPHPDELAWVGAVVPDHPAFVGIPIAEPDKNGPVRVSTVNADDLRGSLAWIDDLAEGDRAVLLSDVIPAEPAARTIATALAERGVELLHAVYLDDAIDIPACGGLSVQRTAPHPDRGDLAEANLGAVTADGSEPDWERTRAAFAKVVSEYQRALADASAARAENESAVADTESAAVEAAVAGANKQVSHLRAKLGKAEAQRDRARRQLESARASATMRVGEAVVAVARNPIRGARQSTTLLREAWRTHRSPAPAQTPTSRRATGPVESRVAAPTPEPVTPRNAAPRLRAQDAPWLDFRLPMPAPPGDGRRQPSPMHINLPAKYFVSRLLKRHGVGGYEPSMVAWYLALCDTAGPGAVWDVGANLGVYALLARAYTDREVVAFEPTPDLANWADNLAAVNDLRYPVERIAASDFTGTATFYLSELSDASNSLNEGFRPSTRQLDVLVEPLDRYTRRTGSVPAILKIDTETTEPQVLRGAERLVSEHRPWIFCEVLANRDREGHLAQIMGRHDYRFFHLDGSDPLVETDVIVGDRTYTHMNYLFAPTEIPDDTVAAARAWTTVLDATPKP